MRTEYNYYYKKTQYLHNEMYLKLETKEGKRINKI